MGQDDFERQGVDPSAAERDDEAWVDLGPRSGDSAICVSTFDCPTCGQHRGHWDMD